MSKGILVLFVLVFAIAAGTTFFFLKTEAEPPPPPPNKSSASTMSSNLCSNPLRVVAQPNTWSNKIDVDTGCNWETHHDPEYGQENLCGLIEIRINGDDTLIMKTGCLSNGTEVHAVFPKNVIAYFIQLRSLEVGAVHMVVNRMKQR